MKRFHRILAAWVVSGGVLAADSGFEETFPQFLDHYCIKCHGANKQKGDRRFDTLSLPIEDSATLILLQDMLDILNLGEMPPEDEEKRPEVAELLPMIDRLTQSIESHQELLASTDRQSVLRRLNRREYLNTVRDLFKVNISVFDPTQSFPPDETDHHLDTLGDQLVTSAYLLDRYFEAADVIIEKVFAPDKEPKVQTWHFAGNFRNLEGLDTVMEKIANYEYMALYELPTSVQHRGAYGTINDFLKGVPVDGFYKIRVLAEAKNRVHSFIPRHSSTNIHQPHELAIVPGSLLAGEIGFPQHIEPTLASFTLPDDRLQWCEATVWLDAGYTPRFTFPNGTYNIRSAFRDLFVEIAPHLDEKLENDFENRRFVVLKYGNLPQILIHEVEITGPLDYTWPTISQRSIFQGESFTPGRAAELIEGFASRAFRRTATEDEVSQLIAFYRLRLQAGIPEFQAFKETLKRVLCSPGFLYLVEPSDEEGRLTGHALASRLSYFIWSSMPDEELSQLASQNRLGEPTILSTQIRRMLLDPKVDALVNNFVELFLTLKDLGSQPPDPNSFPIYYTRNLQKYMYEETRLFIQYLFEENRPISDLMNADYTFINEPLAELYGYEGIHGLDFRKIHIPDPLRRGVLGQASILTTTANGIDTSPVIRGVWMLENILGTPPSPPPPNVKPFDPDTRGAVSLRDQLEKHRKNPTCYECHRKIDPLGFALEAFDPIGRSRVAYENDVPVDCSGTLPDGASFESIAGLKQILLGRRSQITRAITTKLLALGAGRRMEPGDRKEIDRIVRQLEEQGEGFKDLFELVALSEVVQRK